MRKNYKVSVTSSEKAFLDECATRQGKTPEQAEEDDLKFWSNDDE